MHARSTTLIITVAVILVLVAASAIFILPSMMPYTTSSTSTTSSISTTTSSTTTTFMAPGSYQLSFEFEDLNRSYLLHIPPSYDGNRLTPLVIALHGFGESLNTFMSSYGGSTFTVKSDKEGFIVVFPEGVDLGWNGPFCCGTAHKNNINDVGFIRELINRLQQQLRIDPSRIYVAGFSNGAIMAYRLAAELSDKIAAIAAVEGAIGGRENQSAPLNTIAEPSQPVSVIIFHGTGDTVVPYEGGLSTNQQSYGMVFLSVADAVAFWGKADGCSKDPKIEKSANGNVVKDAYTGGAKNTEVVLYTLVGWTHGWPKQPLTNVFNLGGINATDIIWDFFSSHPKQS